MKFFEKRPEVKRDIEKEAVNELNNPEMEALSNKFFETSTKIVGLHVSEGGAEGPFKDEYLEATEDEKKLLEERGKEIALYSTKKMAKIKEKGGFFTHKNHWRYHFLKPQWLEEILDNLDKNEKIRVFEEICSRMNKNLTDVEKEKISVWEKEQAKKEITTDKQNLQTLLPFLPEHEAETSDRLIQEARRKE